MSDALPSTEVTELPFVPDEQWLTAEQVAAHWGFSQGIVNRWRKDNFIAEGFFKGRGQNRRYHPDVIPELQRWFNEFGVWRRGRGRGATVKEFFAQRGAGERAPAGAANQ